MERRGSITYATGAPSPSLRPLGARVLHHALGMNLTTSRDHVLRVAFGLVIATEALLFSGLVLARGALPEMPSPTAMVLACAVTLALFTGAGALATSVRRIGDGLAEATSRLVAIASLLGLVALATELGSVRLFAADPVALAIRGLHLAHVAAAIALAVWALGLVRTGRIHRRHHAVLELVATYWYFVGVVWLVVWPFVLGPR